MSKTSILVIFPVREIICFVHFSIKISWRLHSFPHRLTFSFKIILYFHLMSWNIDAIFVFLRWGNMVKKLEWRCDPIFSFFIFLGRGRAFTRRWWLKSLIVGERYLKGVNLLSHDYLKINRNNLYRPLIKPFKQYLTLLFWFQNKKISQFIPLLILLQVKKMKETNYLLCSFLERKEDLKCGTII